MGYAIVTGGSSGIGYSALKILTDKKHIAYNLDLNTCEDKRFKSLTCDVGDIESVKKCTNTIFDQTNNQVDFLVINAGIHYSANLEATNPDILNKMINTNIIGAYHVLKKVLPVMRKNKKGSIVIVASDQTFIGKKNAFAYNMTKAALGSIARTTALDYAQYNIRVNAVCPGTIDTELYHNAIHHYCKQTGCDVEQAHKKEALSQPLHRIGKPEEVAELIVFLLEKGHFMTGSLVAIDGGYTAQ